MNGKKLAKLREKQKITQRELSYLLGVTSQTVSNWEVGRQQPKLTIEDVVLLCNILNCQPSDLI